MALKRFAMYGAATLTALTLASCGGDGDVAENASPTSYDRQAHLDELLGVKTDSTKWESEDDIRDALAQIDACDDYREGSSGNAYLCDGSRVSYMFSMNNEDSNTRALALQIAATDGDGGKSAVVWGGEWTIAVISAVCGSESARSMDELSTGISGVEGSNYCN